MKVEFLDDLTAGGTFNDVVSEKLIRLFDFDAHEAASFQNAIRQLIRSGKRFVLDDLPFVVPVNCSLAFTLVQQNTGIEKISETEFECKLPEQSFNEMVMLIQPFVERESPAHQWLWNDEIDLLFSPGGTW